MPERRYADRHGHAWCVRADRTPAGEWLLAFTDNGIRLQAAIPAAAEPVSLSETDVKNLFCDAERIIQEDGDTWYVGFRQRPVGRQGRFQSGLCTRFRSASGKLHYCRDMIDFRHMPEALLRERLAEARGGR